MKLDSTLFTYELYESGFWEYLGLSYLDSLDYGRFIDKVKECMVGYCDGGDLYVRPRKDCYAIMCEGDGEKFWFHISKELCECSGIVCQE